MLQILKRRIKNLLGIYKSADSRAVQRLQQIDLQPDDIAFDCGANVGTVTQLLADSGARVYAFEPNPVAFAELNRRFKKNKRVTCLNQAISNQDGTMRLYLHEMSDDDPLRWSTGSSLIETKGNIHRDHFVETEVIDLARFVTELNETVKFIKMDIEGAEYRTIIHLIETGAIQQIGLLSVETHHRKNEQLQSEFKQLSELMDTYNIVNVQFDWF
jgi:FkbM family methyltransferase